MQPDAADPARPTEITDRMVTDNEGRSEDRQRAGTMGRGKFRVYLGAAPGVGKTYAMLEEGRRRKARGTDVVVGLAETHGRRHTAELLEGMEIIPRREISYRGTSFTLSLIH